MSPKKPGKKKPANKKARKKAVRRPLTAAKMEAKALEAVKWLRSGRKIGEITGRLRMSAEQIHIVILASPNAITALRGLYGPMVNLTTSQRQGARRKVLHTISTTTGFSIEQLEKIFSNQP